VKEKVAQKDEEKIEELEQTLFELRGEIGAGRHVPPGVRVFSLFANPAQDWADLCQAALDRLKEKNTALLERLRPARCQAHTALYQPLTPPPPPVMLVAPLFLRSSSRVRAGRWSARRRRSWRKSCVRRRSECCDSGRCSLPRTAEFREALLAILSIKVAFYDNGLGATFFSGLRRGALGKKAMRVLLVSQGECGPQELS
jgi:mitotic spindle assembly checkpoint protein MAD1